MEFPRTVVFAYHEMGCIGLEQLIKQGFKIVAVITHRDQSGEYCFFPSVAELAKRYSLTTLFTEEYSNRELEQYVSSCRPEFIFSFYYRRILPASVLALAKQGAYNLHGSLLPRYRGCAPLNWVLIRGEKQTGVSLHKMVARVDAGPILDQEVVEILPRLDALGLHRLLCNAAQRLLMRALPQLLDKTYRLIEQDEGSASYCSRRRPTDGQIDWKRSATEIDRLIRGLNFPYPGARAHYQGKVVVFWEAYPMTSASQASPGYIESLKPLSVRCGTGVLHVLRAQYLDRYTPPNPASNMAVEDVQIGQFFH